MAKFVLMGGRVVNLDRICSIVGRDRPISVHGEQPPQGYFICLADGERVTIDLDEFKWLQEHYVFRSIRGHDDN